MRRVPRRGADAPALTPYNLPIPDWNKRKMTSADFEAACRREGIAVVRDDGLRGARGFYARIKGQPTICISTRLEGAERISVEFHELAHYFLHRDNQAAHRMMKANGKYPKETPAQKWAEHEANTAAFVALAPGFPFNFLLQTLAVRAAKFWRKGERAGEKGGAR